MEDLYLLGNIELFRTLSKRKKQWSTNFPTLGTRNSNEKQEKNFENYLLNISKKVQIPLIASQEVFYLREDMYEAHDALICIGQKNFIDDKNRLKYNNQHYYQC